MAGDRIHIEGLKLKTVVGVPDAERSAPQTVSVNITIEPGSPLTDLEDDIEKTIDYFKVTQSLKAVADRGERKLIETLAGDLAAAVLAVDGVEAVTVEVRKFILPETDFVSVTHRRER